MTDTLLNSPPGENALTAQTCRTQHQTWTALLVQHEQEIDQLLTLLADLPDHHLYRSLRHRAVDYCESLNLLRNRVQRLRIDGICDGLICAPTEWTACSESRFGLAATLSAQVRSLTDDLGRVTAGCYQFLSVMVSLNLL